MCSSKQKKGPPPTLKLTSIPFLSNSPSSNSHMKSPNQYGSILFLSATVVSGLLYFGLCLAAEFSKLKKNELRFDGRLCYLPRSSAFGFGFGALICLCIAQIVGNLFIRNGACFCKVRKPPVSCVLLVFSWISFGVAVILISVATSMSQRQELGEGWLDGECYLVRDGVYIGSALLGLIALGSGVVSKRIMLSEEYTQGNSSTS